MGKRTTIGHALELVRQLRRKIDYRLSIDRDKNLHHVGNTKCPERLASIRKANPAGRLWAATARGSALLEDREAIHEGRILPYCRFCLSYRDVEELLFERGVIVTYETIRR
jgi:hypothetical protein